MERLGGSTEREQAHYEARVRLARLAMAMVENFTPGHDVEQTPDYQQLQGDYLQEQVNLQWLDTGLTDINRFTCG